MASLIEGYNYDIFISYRQKDNKNDGWVTEFVDHLKGELESTFKEEISLYFDINPHDGLLETYDVDASLKEKLKCLVFIPIISRTYCDPGSFAWENEFKAFVEQASADRFGLKIKLIDGNVASRILPVRIHELDTEDKILLEKELHGSLRAVDFIYREPGVNRPLMPDDDEEKNLNNTRYRNQINKTANAVKGIIYSLKKESGTAAGTTLPPETASETLLTSRNKFKRVFNPDGKKKSVLASATIILLCTAILITLFKIPWNNEQALKKKRYEKTIAVLPFENMGEKDENAWFGDAITEEIIMQLYKINELKVRSRTSVMRYKATIKPIPLIAQELNANYIIEGSSQIFDDQVLIRVQLIDARKDEHLWGETFRGTWGDLLNMQVEIAKQTAVNLKAVLSPEERVRIEKDPTKNSGAYMSYLSANVLSNNALYFLMVGNKLVDSVNFASAIMMYDKAIKDDPRFALAYAKRAIARSWGYYTGQLDESHIEKCLSDIDRALEIEEDLPDAQIALGFYYYYCTKDHHKALNHFKIAANSNPANYQPLFYMAMVYRKTGDWKNSQELLMKVIEAEPQDALILTNIGISFNYLHSFDSALFFHEKAIEVMPNWPAPYRNMIESLILKYGNTTKAREVLNTAILKTGNKFKDLKILLCIYEGRFEDALKEIETISSGDFENPGLRHLTAGWIYRLVNDQHTAGIQNDSALSFFKQSIINNPQNPYAYAYCGIAYAGSGNITDAIVSGRTAVELARDDNLIRSDMMVNLAKILVIAGDYANAISLIEDLLKMPSSFSLNLIKIDPSWKAITTFPDYKVLTGKNPGT